MFAKLLKYDLKSNAGLLSLLGGCVLGVGCVAAVILRLLTTHWDAISAKDELMLVMIPASLFLFAAYMVIIFYVASVPYIQLFRFYKSRFTDEGYLTFTLPVKTSHVFLSSAVSILIWNIIAFVVMVAALGIAVGIGPKWPDEILSELHMNFSIMGLAASDTFNPGMIPGYVIFVIVSLVYSIISPMTAVVLGASVAKKHKIITIIAIMIGISVFYGMLSGVVSSLMQVLLFVWEDKESLILTLTPYINSIFPIILSALGYIVSIHVMKKRLNLP